MLHPDDELTLQRLIGRNDLPQALRDKAELWTRLYHRDGHAGRIGTLPLVILVDQFNLAPPPPPVDTSLDDWRNVPVGTRIECKQFGDYVQAVYQGLAP